MKSVKNYIVFVSGLVLLIGLSGCAGYKARPLPKLTKRSLDEKSISLDYRVFDKSDCKKYLDRDVIKQGYQPILISITNNSNRAIQFSRKNINLPTIDAYEVAQKVHTNTVGRAVGYGTAAVLSCGLFAIPAIVDGVGSAKANDQLDIDFDTKTLRDQVIEPSETVNGLIFVPIESFKANFKIVLSEPKTSQRIVLSPSQPLAEVLQV